MLDLETTRHLRNMKTDLSNSRYLCSRIFKSVRKSFMVRTVFGATRQKKKSILLLFSSSFVITFLIFGTIAAILGVSNHQAHVIVRNALTVANESHIQQESTTRRRGVVMSCPVGQTQNHRGSWKPRNMVRGVEAVIKQLQAFESDIPLFFGYYDTEKHRAEPWCRNISEAYSGSIEIVCFQIPEQFPKDMYGYAKIFAIRHAPIDEALWLDCDVFPVRSLGPLFEDEEFRKTGAMFWPDSRDFFDEAKLGSILNIGRNSVTFPLNAWWVRQGFDSGLVLLNRKTCARQIDAICRITQSPELKVLRDLSMGDKDIFHVVWMLHNKNFTLVPYLGESGNIQARMKSRRIGRRRFRTSTPGFVGWQMSSQLKYGRDGLVYALHQLHRQPGFALIATLGHGQSFLRLKGWEYMSYVKPMVTVRKDLRIGTEMRKVGAYADFVGEIESVLTKMKSGKRRIPRTLDERMGSEKGLEIRRAPEWIGRAAEAISKTWRPKANLGGISGKNRQTQMESALLTTLGAEKYGRHVHNKLRRRFNARNGYRRGHINKK